MGLSKFEKQWIKETAKQRGIQNRKTLEKQHEIEARTEARARSKQQERDLINATLSIHGGDCDGLVQLMSLYNSARDEGEARSAICKQIRSYYLPQEKEELMHLLSYMRNEIDNHKFSKIGTTLFKKFKEGVALATKFESDPEVCETNRRYQEYIKLKKLFKKITWYVILALIVVAIISVINYPYLILVYFFIAGFGMIALVLIYSR